MTGSTFSQSHSNWATQIFSLPVEPVGNSTRLPIGVTGDIPNINSSHLYMLHQISLVVVFCREVWACLTLVGQVAAAVLRTVVSLLVAAGRRSVTVHSSAVLVSVHVVTETGATKIMIMMRMTLFKLNVVPQFCIQTRKRRSVSETSLHVSCKCVDKKQTEQYHRKP